VFFGPKQQESLNLIFDFYKDTVSVELARKMRNSILTDVRYLQTGLISTAKESLLDDFEKDYRFLVSGNFKIIYFRESDKIVISLVFDARQNPEKLTKLLK